MEAFPESASWARHGQICRVRSEMPGTGPWRRRLPWDAPVMVSMSARRQTGSPLHIAARYFITQLIRAGFTELWRSGRLLKWRYLELTRLQGRFVPVPMISAPLRGVIRPQLYGTLTGAPSTTWFW